MDLFGGPQQAGWFPILTCAWAGTGGMNPRGPSSNSTSKATDGPKLSVSSFADLCLLQLFQQAARRLLITEMHFIIFSWA